MSGGRLLIKSSTSSSPPLGEDGIHPQSQNRSTQVRKNVDAYSEDLFAVVFESGEVSPIRT